MDFETIARNNHRNGMNCATAVYSALAEINTNKTTPPMLRSDGGKCGTVLAAEQILREMGKSQDTIDAFDKQFTEQFGSLPCDPYISIPRRGLRHAYLYRLWHGGSILWCAG